MLNMLMIASTVIGAAGQMAAGQAAQAAGELNAFNQETDKVRRETQTLQNSNDRLEQWRFNSSANVAMRSAAGIDVYAGIGLSPESGDRSVSAFFAKQKEIVGDDLNRISFQGNAEAAKMQQQATAFRIQGRAQRQAATIGALTSLATGIYKYGDLAPIPKVGVIS